MSRRSDSALKALQKEIDADLDSFTSDLVKELKNTTPVDTGRAKRGWRKRSTPSIAKNNQTIIENRVPYISPLDDGHSKQAANGIVVPALKKVLGRYKR